MSTRETLSISNTTKGKLPRLPFYDMKRSVLGPVYDLSLVIVGDKRSRTLNEEHRGKDYVPNVLAFPLDNASGEIFINLHQAKREASRFDMTYKNFVGYLFIHALLHLKGYTHGSRMNRIEKKLKANFNL